MNNGEDWSEEAERRAEEAIRYVFSDKQLLRTCFTHSSFTNVGGGRNNERLEFLGDAVLQLIVTEELYHDGEKSEGELTELRQRYVSRSALERAEARLGLMRFMRRSGGESNVGGKTASNLFEAVLGGIYLDGGMQAARAFLSRTLSETEFWNYKTKLQELVQERVKTTPEYHVYEIDGGYACTVRALGKAARGSGASKKAAETAAAKSLYKALTDEVSE